MSLKENWKATGAGLGNAFKDLGKTLGKTATTVTDQLEECEAPLKDDWKATGSSLGHAFTDLGKTLVKTATTTATKVDQWANSTIDPPAEAPKDDVQE